jgi:hypothetical protein
VTSYIVGHSALTDSVGLDRVEAGASGEVGDEFGGFVLEHFDRARMLLAVDDELFDLEKHSAGQLESVKDVRQWNSY